MIDKISKWIDRKTTKNINTNEDLSWPIRLGDVQKDSDENPTWTSQRIDNIIKQMEKLESMGRNIKLRTPMYYSDFTGYWARISFDVVNDIDIEMRVEVSIFLEHWLDKHDMIKSDTRTEMETMGTYHTREIEFNQEVTPYSILEIIRTAANDMGTENIRKHIKMIEDAKLLRGAQI